MGLLLGMKCAIPVGQVQAACVAEGLMAITAGDNVLRLAPPLVVTDGDLDEAVVMLRRATRRVLPSVQQGGGAMSASAAAPAARSRASPPSRRPRPRHFLDLRDFDGATLRQMLDVAANYKRAGVSRRARWPARRWR